MNRHLLAASIAMFSVALVGCQRETPAATEATATVPTSADLPQAVVRPDAGGFAGTFKAPLPCADCPGIDETLELKTGGSFTLTDVYRERPQGTQTVAGHWVVEDNNKRLHLVSSTSTNPDRLYAIGSHDEVTALGKDGRQTSGPALHRSP